MNKTAYNKQFRRKVGISDNPCDSEVINLSPQFKRSWLILFSSLCHLSVHNSP